MVAGYRHKPHENRTPRIPEPIIAPLLAWSLKYIAAFAPDIFAARDELTALQMRRAALQADDAVLSNKDRRTLYRERLVAFFEDRRRHGCGVPIWTTAHNGAVRQMHVPVRSPRRSTRIFSIFMPASMLWPNPRPISNSPLAHQT